MLEEPTLDFTGMSTAVSDSLAWVTSTMELFTTAPAIYFVAFAVLGAAAGVARRFVPMKKK